MADIDDTYEFPDEKAARNAADGTNIAAPEDDIEIEIVDDTPEADRGRPALAEDVADPTDDEINSYSKDVQARIKKLTHARHDERRSKEATIREKQELERYTQHLIDENKQLKAYVDVGSKKYAETAKSAADAELEAARRQYKDAQEAFDTDGILAAQEALMDAKVKVEAAKNFRAPTLQTQESVVQPQHTESQSAAPDERTLRWQAKNQWFGAQGFEEVTSFALGLHQKLVNTGVDPRTEAYFEQVDARMKSTFPDMFGEQDKPRSGEPPTKKPASVVAPATRSAGVRKVQLTQTQQALIKRYNLDPKQYAAEFLKMENQNG